MKKFTLLLLLILFFSASMFAQTKRIAHRSHSGNALHYALIEMDNLGLSPDMARKMSRRYDSTQKVKLKQDSINSRHQMDSLKRLKKSDVKNKGQKKKPLKINKKPTKLKQKTEPLPPNKKNKGSSKSQLLLLFFIAIPIGTIAIFSRKL